MSKKYIIATIKEWNIENYKKHFNKSDLFHLITDKKQLNKQELDKIGPEYIFFPHWSWIIPEEIWRNYNCVVFHMTDLPYGRGGTPLQNLIIRGFKKTKISAIKVDGGIDTGDVYMKNELDLGGKASEIYKRASDIIFNEMIPFIISNNPAPRQQSGKIVSFERLKPSQSQITDDFDLDKIYDQIRMLDAEGYPQACIELEKIKVDFSNADVKIINGKKIVTANVQIYEK